MVGSSVSLFSRYLLSASSLPSRSDQLVWHNRLSSDAFLSLSLSSFSFFSLPSPIFFFDSIHARRNFLVRAHDFFVFFAFSLIIVIFLARLLCFRGFSSNFFSLSLDLMLKSFFCVPGIFVHRCGRKLKVSERVLFVLA